MKLDLENIDVKEKLQMAINTNDVNLLTLLIKDRAMLVRRAVARNKNTPTSVLNILAYDQSSNVVYHAIKNKNCTVTRNINDANHPCVMCDKRGDQMDCENCPTLEEYSILSKQVV